MLTTGARHPYKIDEKYLTSRKVSAYTDDGSFEPRCLSGYQLKELIWTDWRQEDWEARPASPSSIRLILMGRMIEDKGVLKGESAWRSVAMSGWSEVDWTGMSSGWDECHADDISIDFPFNMEQTNVVHMTVKPADLIEDETEPSAKGKGGVLRQRDTEGEESGSGCRCVIQ
jgi:hypothetical protein